MNTNLTAPGTNGEAADTTRSDIRHLSIQQLAQLGVSQVAYVRPVLMNGALGFAIHAADGTPMAVAAEQETALEAIRQHDMLPLLLH
jgi:hypothetical protein